MSLHRGCSRRGFTLIELVTVVLILGILATIGLPRLKAYRTRAEAASVLASAKKLEFGLIAASEGTGLLPETQAGAITNATLLQNLPSSFPMSTSSYMMIWIPNAARQSGTIMLTLLDGALCAPIYAAFGSTSSAGGQVTLASCPSNGGVGILMLAVQ